MIGPYRQRLRQRWYANRRRAVYRVAAGKGRSHASRTPVCPYYAKRENIFPSERRANAMDTSWESRAGRSGRARRTVDRGML